MNAKVTAAVSVQQIGGKYQQASVQGTETAKDLAIQFALLRKNTRHVEARLIAELRRLGMESLKTEAGRFTMVGEVNASFVDKAMVNDYLLNNLMFTPAQAEHAIIKCSKPACRAAYVRVYPGKGSPADGGTPHPS